MTLVFPEPVPGLSDEALLCLGVELGFEPDIVIGHGHISGAVATARTRQFHRGARRIHVLHTLPDEIEPFKDREGEDPAQRAHRKQETEAAQAISASLAVAVGPRLHRQWSTYIGVARGVGVHRLTPGLPDLEPVRAVPAACWCLMMGRLEDAELKGVNLASAALGIVNKDEHFRGSKEVTLVLRGAEAGKSQELRSYVHGFAGAEIPCTIREYTHLEAQVRRDIARSSVVLMPSQMEGFGLVGVEALAMGVPILISQRSGLGELLLELIDADPKLEFARKFIVEVGDGADQDAVRWAAAIRGVLVDRARTFREASVLREAILKADYWRRAVDDMFSVLKISQRDPKMPPDVPPDLTRRARRLLEIDPATAIVYSSSILEREMERIVTSKGIAKPGLTAPQYLGLLVGKGFLDSAEARIARKVLHLRNMAAHKFDAAFTKDTAEEHIRLVEELVEQLNRERPPRSAAVDVDVSRTPAEAGGASPGLRPPQWRLVTQKTEGFVGRDFAFDYFDEFFSKNSSGYIVVEGTPGIGKSSLLAEFVRRTLAPAHFNVRAEGVVHVAQFVESIHTQLGQRFGIDVALPEGAARDGRHIEHLLEESSKCLPPGERLVVVVDALDEIEFSGTHGANPLFLPTSLPGGVFLLVSRRSHTAVLQVEGDLGLLDLMDRSAENRRDVEQFIRTALAKLGTKATLADAAEFETLVGLLIERSEHNFIYLHYVLRDIGDGRLRGRALGDLPLGLRGYYERHWEQMTASRTDDRPRFRTIYALAELGHPVTPSLLAACIGEEELAVHRFLDEWAQFLEIGRSAGGRPARVYSLYHKSFADFLAEKGTIRAARVDLGDLRQRIGDGLLGGFDLDG